MKMLTDIDKSDYLYCLEEDNNELSTTLEAAIANGIQLEDLTNGEVLMKMFPKLRVTIMKDCVQVMGENYEFNITFSLDWWNRKWGE